MTLIRLKGAKRGNPLLMFESYMHKAHKYLPKSTFLIEE
jgi:hypothetical protein